MEFLNEHLRVKKKYYAIYKYIMNDFKEPNKTMQMILDKHKKVNFLVWEDLEMISEIKLMMITPVKIMIL
jgi:hypothetical protein